MKIEKNIPIPPPRRAERSGAFPFTDMQEGESVFLADSPEHKTPPAARLTRAAHQYRKVHDPAFHYTIRTVEGGARLWRISNEQ